MDAEEQAQEQAFTQRRRARRDGMTWCSDQLLADLADARTGLRRSKITPEVQIMDFVTKPDVQMAVDVSSGEQVCETPWGIFPIRRDDVLVPHGNKTVPVPKALWQQWFDEYVPEPAVEAEPAKADPADTTPDWAVNHGSWFLELAEDLAVEHGTALKEPTKAEVFDYARAEGIDVDATMRKDEMVRVIDDARSDDMGRF